MTVRWTVRSVGDQSAQSALRPSPILSTNFIFGHFRNCHLGFFEAYADLAHLVERDLAKVEVAGSSPVIRSKVTFAYRKGDFFVYFE